MGPQALSHPLSLWGRSTAFCPYSPPSFPLLGICHGEGARRDHLSTEVLETKSDTGPSFRRGLLSQLPSPHGPQRWAYIAPPLQSCSPLTETRALEPRAEHPQLHGCGSPGHDPWRTVHAQAFLRPQIPGHIQLRTPCCGSSLRSVSNVSTAPVLSPLLG